MQSMNDDDIVPNPIGFVRRKVGIIPKDDGSVRIDRLNWSQRNNEIDIHVCRGDRDSIKGKESEISSRRVFGALLMIYQFDCRHGFLRLRR